jgi:hypothetical protein
VVAHSAGVMVIDGSGGGPCSLGLLGGRVVVTVGRDSIEGAGDTDRVVSASDDLLLLK